MSLRRTHVGPFDVAEADRSADHPAGGGRRGPVPGTVTVTVTVSATCDEDCSRTWRVGPWPARRGARDLRRRPSRPPPRDRDAARRRAGADGRHVRSAPAHRTRQQGRPADVARASAGAARRARSRGGARRRVHARRRRGWSRRPSRTSSSGRSAPRRSSRARTSASGARRQGDLTLLESLGFATRPVALLENVSSRLIRELVRDGDVDGAAQLLGRPVEVEGIVVTGDARGGTLGFPTANLDVRPELLVPQNGIYAGAAGETPRSRLDRDEPALRRQRAPRRGVPARLRGRPLRPAAGRRALGAAP